MALSFAHANLLVKDLDRSVKFYQQALNLKEIERKEYPDAFMVLMRNSECGMRNFTLELRKFKEPIDFEVDKRLNHIAFFTDDFEGDLNRHKQMNCVDRVLEEFGIYFITDPDGHYIEILRSVKNG